MLTLVRNRSDILGTDHKGFTLIEIIVVITIIGILFAVSVPKFMNYREKAIEDVCRTNRLQIKRMYESFLVLENNEHSNIIFTQYLQDYGQTICPNDSEISYSMSQNGYKVG